MKKNLLLIALTMVAMLSIGSMVLTSINHKHEVEMKQIKTEYEDQIKDKESEIESLKQDYDEKLYNVINGDDYDITIEHDGETVNYTKKMGETKFEKLLHIAKTSKTTIK